MTANQCVSEILRPFQGVLNALAIRESQAADLRVNKPESSPSAQSLRTRVSREFHIWDRVKESLKSPDTLRAEANNLAVALVPPIKNEGLEPLPGPTALARSRNSLERAKTTSTRLKSLEAHLNQAKN